MSFSSIPVLDLSQARDPERKPAFLADLRRALVEVGFLYIGNYGVDQALVDDVIRNGREFFDLPESVKMAVDMKNVDSFLGYAKLGNEITASRTDWREQIELSTPHPLPAPDAPAYEHLRAPNQWPDAALMPSFRPVFEKYIAAMSQLSVDFTRLIAEALGLPADAFDRFFDQDQQHKLKIIKYPDRADLGGSTSTGTGTRSHGKGSADGGRPEDRTPEGWTQGVGPHKDSMLLAFLLQASPHKGLQAQNLAGQWIDCPPLPDTQVVAIGQGLEALTGGVCAATTHRVLSPPAGQGARFSIPFFQGVSWHASLADARVDVPEAVRAQRDAFFDALPPHLAELARKERAAVPFAFVRGGRWENLGQAVLWFRCKSHPDVAQRWYPDLWREVCRDAEHKGMEREAQAAKEAKDAAAAAAPTPSATPIQAH